MSTNLNGQIKSLFKKSLAIQFGMLLIIFAITTMAINTSRDELAEAITRPVRNQIVSGDMRSAIVTLNGYIPEQFTAIEYVNSDNGFHLPPGYKQRSLRKFYERSYEVPIRLSTKNSIDPSTNNNVDLIGTLVFHSSRLSELWLPALSGFVLLLVAYPLYRRARKSLVERNEIEENANRNSMIAQTSKMVAHDVRAPFSTIRSAMALIAQSNSIEDVKEVVSQVFPSIKNAMANVNNTLNDILSSGSPQDLTLDETSPCSMIEVAINEVFMDQRGTEVTFHYDFKHEHKSMVDSEKMRRVFYNIIKNAVQASHGKCDITFSTREFKTKNGQRLTCYKIKNTNSSIKKEDLDKVFLQFFTKGKRDGNGLGLAIVKQFVIAHGGVVRCNSSESQNWVEFSLTVPSGTSQHDFDVAQLPKSSKQIESKWIGINKNSPGNEISEIEKTLRSLVTPENPCKVLIVDDEIIYQRGLQAEFNKHTDIAGSLKFYMASSYRMALAIATATNPDLIICDIDLGKNSKDGFETVKALRDLGIRSHICIHSNRTREQSIKQAHEAGADEFLPKPMHFEHLIGHVVIALTKSKMKKDVPESEFSVIDDDESVRFLWMKTVKDARVNSFSTPEEFLKRVEEDKEFLARQSVIITDFHFGSLSAFSGAGFALLLYSGFNREAILSSDISDLSREESAVFQAVIPKNPVGLAKLKSLSA